MTEKGRDIGWPSTGPIVSPVEQIVDQLYEPDQSKYSLEDAWLERSAGGGLQPQKGNLEHTGAILHNGTGL
jgi:hypothetical protein